MADNEAPIDHEDSISSQDPNNLEVKKEKSRRPASERSLANSREEAMR
jgi:hypothetical protein